MDTGYLSNRWKRPLVQFSAVIVLGLFVVGGGAIWASQRAGHREALNEARSLTEQSARSLILPNLSQELLDGSPAALSQLDDGVRNHLLGDRVLRVKVWAEDGTVVYSDVEELIGETYELEPDRLQAVEHAVTVADVGDLEGPENRFERDLGPLLEVYLPIRGPDGQTLLFETYFDADSLQTASGRIRSTVVPIILVSLGLMGALTLVMAKQMSARMDRARVERERLLARAVDASAFERRRIAADLHDGVIQDLAGTALLLSSAETVVKDDPLAKTRLGAAADALRQSLASLRALAIEIHPPNLESVDFRQALAELLERTQLRHDVETTLNYADSVEIGDMDHKRLVYRFVAEGLRNVAKHANANTVELSVRTQESSGLLVDLIDDGVGFDEVESETVASAGEGMGLRLLRELAAEIGATVSIERVSSAGGTALCLEISS